MMKYAFITGVSGFVGKHIRNQLLRENWQVSGFDVRPSGGHDFVGDLSDHTALLNAIRESKPDVVFHLAGVTKSNESEVYFKANLLGTLNLFDAIMQTKLRPKVVLASSSAVYGLTEGKRPITERFTIRPMTEYAISKVSQEAAALRYYYAFGLPVVIARMFNLLGPGQPPDLACSAFARQIALAEVSGENEINAGNLDSLRDFVDVRDAVRAFAMLAVNGKAGQVYNICSARGVTIKNCLYEMMSLSPKQLSVKIDARRVQKNDVPAQVGSYAKLYKATGWDPKIPLKQSLSDLLDDWRIRVESKETK